MNIKAILRVITVIYLSLSLSISLLSCSVFDRDDGDQTNSTAGGGQSSVGDSNNAGQNSNGNTTPPSEGTEPDGGNTNTPSEGTDPDGGNTNPPSEGTEPDSGNTNPPSEGTDPDGGNTNPPSEGTDPDSGNTNPPSEGTEPDGGNTNPPSEGTEPDGGNTNPPSEGTEPDSGNTNPPSEGTEPDGGNTTPPSEGTDPDSGNTNPPSEGTEPDGGNTNPPSEGTEPDGGNTNPPSEGTDPDSGNTNPPSEGTDPDSGNTNPPSEGNEGEIDSELANLNEIRKQEQQLAFAALPSDIFSSEAMESLKLMYSLFDENTFLWLLELYYPEIGGFYYSNSARDNSQFLPDLESTAQALEFFDKSGLDGIYNDSIGDTLPTEIRNAIYNFALSLRHEDGYYYHPQWGTAINSSRKGRDQGWGNDIINAFAPTTPLSSCSNCYSGANSSPLTERLGLSSSAAVSKVVSVAASVDYTNWNSIKALIDSEISNSYSLGNKLNSNIGTIERSGLRDELVSYLTELQYPNGLWEPTVSFNAINGLMKMCGFFGGNYGKFPRAKEALTSTLEILSIDSEVTDEELSDYKTITYLYNVWVILYKLVNHPAKEEKAEFTKILNDSADELFNSAYRILSIFKKDDGGFSYNPESSSYTSQGVHVAVRGTRESDVNATSIAYSTVRYILRVYQLYNDVDFDIPRIYTDLDSSYLNKRLQNKHKSAIKPITTFESFSSSKATYENGVLINPADNLNTAVLDKDTEYGEYIWFDSDVVDNPDTSIGGKVLLAETFVYPDRDKQYAASGKNSYTEQKFDVLEEGDVYVFQTDMMLANASGGVFLELLFIDDDASSSVKLQFGLKNGYIYIVEDNYHKGDNGSESSLPKYIPLSEWFSFKLEVRKKIDSSGNVENITAEITVNGESYGEFVTGRYSASSGYHNYDIEKVRISYYRQSATTLYLDNLYSYRTNE